MNKHSHLLGLVVGAVALMLVLGQAPQTLAQGPAPQAVLGTGFTYQGQLNKSGVPVNDTCNFTFSLWDSPSNATGQVGASQTINSVAVDKGLFTVVLNGGNQFGASAFTGQARWLQTAVQCTGDSSPVTLSRQQLTAAPYAHFAAAPWLTNGNNLSYNAGNVGIGTNAPTEKLTIQTATENYGLIHTDGTAIVGTWVGAGSSGSERGWFGTASNHPLSFFTNNGPAAMTIDTSGRVGIGTTSPDSLTTLTVRRWTANTGNYAIVALNSNNDTLFEVNDLGQVYVGNLTPNLPTTSHICDDILGFLAHCSSAAEYVPTIDGGSGFPETADLVSLAPNIPNPYGDMHAPSVVQKSTTACDPNLLGFILKPESGADGTKLNGHYLPLAIYGYFPAKVTMENGAIKRGDALTSSSKAGYAMKATSACKTIGYALEDADQEGTIQVFAQHGETAAPEVAALRTQVDDLKKQNDALAARLDAIERGQAPLQSGLLPRDVLLWGALAVVGVVLARRWQR